MLHFTWKLQKPIGQTRERIRTNEKLNRQIKIALWGSLVLLVYLSTVETEVEFNRGTVHHTRHLALCIGKCKTDDSALYFKGFGLVDFPQRLLFAALVLTGVACGTHSLIAGIGWGAVFYVIYALVTLAKSKEVFGTIQMLLNA